MANILNIAVFGLSLSTLDHIKTQVLLALPSSIQVKWVNIAESKIDLLLVNDVFFNAPGIQKVLSNPQITYLRLVKKVEHAGRIIGDQLFYPFSNLEHLHEWLSEKLALVTAMPFSLPVREMKVPPILPTITPQVEISIERVFTEIFTPRNGFIQLFDASGFLALIDTRTERVWVDAGKTIQLNSTLNQTYATAQFVQEITKHKEVYDLRVWLWKVVNASTDLKLPVVDLNQNFKLEIWPQFERDLKRNEFLKMAACFSHGAKISDVKHFLNLSHDQILNFVSCAVLLQLGRFVNQNEVKFQEDTKQVESGQGHKLRSFIGKLRKKLGL
ncbi:hypothetical protein E0H82_04090 [Acinetobacter sp. ANC 4910]|uniref:hypothetical protein n=1 Tax=Acinetobacter sp. ANC 4910 TaxID=2529850 RepID=UPI00103A41F6|nr:hypothetical protein [Acinetobacter sp. ANC 4910]TCB36896.1 hypothetical protein E0H82_04090 [Acinetobacter sp. ANC 4910]